MGGRSHLRAIVCLALIVAFLAGSFPAQAAVKTVNILKVKNDYVRLHSDTSGNGEVLATLRKGTKVFYLGRSGSMAYVCTERGVTGFIYAGYLSAYGAVKLANVYYVRSSSLKVYRSPSTSSRRVTTLPKNFYLLLYDANGNWGKVRSLSGNQGYVLLSGLKRAGT